MTTSYDLIPWPREMTEHDGVFSCDSVSQTVCLRGVTAEDAGRLLAAARRILPGLERTEDSAAAMTLEHDPALEFPASARPDVLDQGYVLEVAPGGIRVRARSARGLYHALRTLGQLPRSARGIPACAIRDWPDLPFRCLHVPGFGHIPRYDALLSLVELLADWKYTALLIEYDDRFSFDRYPVLNHPAAFSKQQIRDLIAFAAERYLEVVPCLDSLGHANFYLKHKEFQHLAELPGNMWELCPSNPETLVFIKELWREALEVHRGCRFAAITGDEVFREGGFCPACAKYAKAGKLSLLYTNYYGDLSRWVLEQGVRPMIWADMIEIHPEEIGRLPREAVFADWNYSGHPKGAGGLSLFLRGAGEFRPGEERLVPELYARTFGKYFHSADGTTPFEPFPYLRFFMDRGFEVMSSAMANVMRGGGFLGRIANNRLFCRAAHKARAFGHMNCLWEPYLPVQNSLSGIAAGGAYAWHADDVGEQAFFERFARRALGRDNPLPKAIPVMERLVVTARGFDATPRPGDRALLRETAQALRAAAAAGPDGLYSELMALHVEMARRAAALQETAALKARLEMGAGADQPLDLAPALNWDGAMPKRSGIFDPAPGRQTVHGIPFELADPARHGGRLGVCVAGRAAQFDECYKAAVRFPVSRACDALFFLVAGAWGKEGTRDGLLQFRFSDGTREEFPLVAGRHVRDWSGGMRGAAQPLLEHSVLAWEGSKAIDGGSGYRMGMFLFAWRNPRPAAAIEAIEMQPLDGEPGMTMLFAVTARAAGTTRPAPDIGRVRERAEDLLAELERLAAETVELVARHHALYERLLAPEDAERQKTGLTMPDLGPAMAALRAMLGKGA